MYGEGGDRIDVLMLMCGARDRAWTRRMRSRLAIFVMCAIFLVALRGVLSVLKLIVVANEKCPNVTLLTSHISHLSARRWPPLGAVA